MTQKQREAEQKQKSKFEQMETRVLQMEKNLKQAVSLKENVVYL
jgi:type II secretory pathway component PulJ